MGFRHCGGEFPTCPPMWGRVSNLSTDVGASSNLPNRRKASSKLAATSKEGHPAHGQAYLRHRRRRQLARQGADLCLDRHAPRASRPARPPAEVRSLHQRRSRHHEPVPARRGLCARRRRRDRPRPRPLRALHQRPPQPRLQLHHRQGLSLRHREGTPRRLPRQDRAGDSAHHRRDQGRHPQAGHG